MHTCRSPLGALHGAPSARLDSSRGSGRRSLEAQGRTVPPPARQPLAFSAVTRGRARGGEGSKGCHAVEWMEQTGESPTSCPLSGQLLRHLSQWPPSPIHRLTAEPLTMTLTVVFLASLLIPSAPSLPLLGIPSPKKPPDPSPCLGLSSQGNSDQDIALEPFLPSNPNVATTPR